MAFRRRRNFGRKKNFRKRKFGKKNYVKKVVRRAIHARIGKPEIKHYYQFLGAVAVSSSLSTSGLSLIPIAQGGSSDEFIGDKITCRYIHIKGTVTGSSQTPHNIRIMIVEDMQPMGGALVPYSTTSSFGYLMFRSNTLISPLVFQNDPRRFKVLADWSRVVNPTSEEGHIYNYRKFLKLGNATLSYALGASAAFYPVNRSYLLFVLSDSATLLQDICVDFGFSDS